MQVARHATHLSVLYVGVLYVGVRCVARPAGPGGFALGALGELPVGGLGLRPPSFLWLSTVLAARTLYAPVLSTMKVWARVNSSS